LERRIKALQVDDALREGYYKEQGAGKAQDAAEDIYPDKYLSTESLRHEKENKTCETHCLKALKMLNQ
jgi:hypothetical protein